VKTNNRGSIYSMQRPSVCLTYPLQQTLSRAAEKATTMKNIVTSGEVNQRLSDELTLQQTGRWFQQRRQQRHTGVNTYISINIIINCVLLLLLLTVCSGSIWSFPLFICPHPFPLSTKPSYWFSPLGTYQCTVLVTNNHIVCLCNSVTWLVS
jgi:hypothetical protein